MHAFHDLQCTLPGYVFVKHALNQAQRHVDGNFGIQEQVTFALLEQGTANPVGFLVIVAIWNIAVAGGFQLAQLGVVEA